MASPCTCPRARLRSGPAAENRGPQGRAHHHRHGRAGGARDCGLLERRSSHSQLLARGQPGRRRSFGGVPRTHAERASGHLIHDRRARAGPFHQRGPGPGGRALRPGYGRRQPARLHQRSRPRRNVFGGARGRADGVHHWQRRRAPAHPAGSRADALAVHLNYLQEMIQPEGDTRARGVLAAIRQVVESVGMPVIGKETGAGIALAQAVQLREAGVRALDVGGLGGTSFAIVEASRARLRDKQAKANLGELFAAWGIPTMASIPLAAQAGLPVIGSGGIRSGLDAARALALGATLVGIARPLLVVAQQGLDATAAWIERFLDELRIALFLTGSRTTAELRGKAVLLGRTKEWVEGLSSASTGRPATVPIPTPDRHPQSPVL